MDRTYLSVKEVAQRWRVSPMTVYRLVVEDQLGHTRIGRQIRIDEAEAERYLADNTSHCVAREAVVR